MKSKNDFKEVVIIGAGGSGSWVGLFCAFYGIESITIFDGDTISKKDVENRCAYRKGDINKNKASALGELIQNINQLSNVNIFERPFDFKNDENFLIDGTFVCCDDPNIMERISLHCQEHKLRHVLAPYSNHNAAVFNKFHGILSLQTGTISGWSGSCALAGLLGCFSMFTSNFEAVIDMEGFINGTDNTFNNEKLEKLLKDSNE